MPRDFSFLVLTYGGFVTIIFVHRFKNSDGEMIYTHLIDGKNFEYLSVFT